MVADSGVGNVAGAKVTPLPRPSAGFLMLVAKDRGLPKEGRLSSAWGRMKKGPSAYFPVLVGIP